MFIPRYLYELPLSKLEKWLLCNKMDFKNFRINDLIETVKSTVFQYSPVEAMLVKLTNNDSWGHDTKDLQQLVKMCDNNTGYQASNVNNFNQSGGHSSALAFTLSFLHEKCTNTQVSTWRNIYKSLSLLDYLLKHSSEYNITSITNIVQQLNHLNNYQCIDNGKDTGINVRHKLKTMTEMINNHNVLLSEREKASVQAQKFHGGNTRGFNAKGGLSSEDYYKAGQQGNTSNTSPYQSSSSPSFNPNQSPSQSPKTNPFIKPKEDDDFGDFQSHGGSNKPSQITQNSRDNSADYLDNQNDDEFGDFETEKGPQPEISKSSPIDLLDSFDDKPKGEKLDFNDMAAPIAPIKFVPVPKKANSTASQQSSNIDLLSSPPKQQQNINTMDIFGTSEPAQKAYTATKSPPMDLYGNLTQPKVETIAASGSQNPLNPSMKPLNTQKNDDPFANLVDFSTVKCI